MARTDSLTFDSRRLTSPAMLPTIPPLTEAWWYYLCVGASVFIMALSKGGFGGGIGILSIPLMAMVMGSQHMLGVMLPVLIACDLLANLHYLKEWDWGRLRWMLLGAFVGIAVGTWIFWNLRGMPPASFNRLMNTMVGVLCLGIVALQAYRLFGKEVPSLPAHPASGLSVGVVAGALSTLNHAAGPITTLYLLQEKLEKRVLVGTLLLYTLIGNTAKLPTFLLMPMPDGHPLINAATLRDSIWFIPLIPMGTLLGAWMNRKVPEKPFTAIMYLAAALTAGQMVYKSAFPTPAPAPKAIATTRPHQEARSSDQPIRISISRSAPVIGIATHCP